MSTGAEDAFLALSLNPIHLEPIAAADPFRSRFLIADSGEGEGGGQPARERWLEELTSKALKPAQTYARVYELMQAWPGREVYSELQSIGHPEAVEALSWLARARKDVTYRLNAVSALCALGATEEASLLIPEIVEMVLFSDFRTRQDRDGFWESWGLIPFQGILNHPRTGPILPQIFFLMAGAVTVNQGLAIVDRLSDPSESLAELRTAAIQSLGEILLGNLNRLRGEKFSPRYPSVLRDAARPLGEDAPEDLSALFSQNQPSLERILPVLLGGELRRIVQSLPTPARNQFLQEELRLRAFGQILDDSLKDIGGARYAEVIETMAIFQAFQLILLVINILHKYTVEQLGTFALRYYAGEGF